MNIFQIKSKENRCILLPAPTSEQDKYKSENDVIVFLDVCTVFYSLFHNILIDVSTSVVRNVSFSGNIFKTEETWLIRDKCILIYSTFVFKINYI